MFCKDAKVLFLMFVLMPSSAMASDLNSNNLFGSGVDVGVGFLSSPSGQGYIGDLEWKINPFISIETSLMLIDVVPDINFEDVADKIGNAIGDDSSEDLSSNAITAKTSHIEMGVKLGYPLDATNSLTIVPHFIFGASQLNMDNYELTLSDTSGLSSDLKKSYIYPKETVNRYVVGIGFVIAWDNKHLLTAGTRGYINNSRSDNWGGQSSRYTIEYEYRPDLFGGRIGFVSNDQCGEPLFYTSVVWGF